MEEKSKQASTTERNEVISTVCRLGFMEIREVIMMMQEKRMRKCTDNTDMDMYQ